MFLIKRKQGGFISAELGIGILVISLLAIMGFLAATDLDDEINRAPANAPDTALASSFKLSLSSLQSALDNPGYEALWNELSEQYSDKTLYDKHAQAIGMIHTEWDTTTNTGYFDYKAWKYLPGGGMRLVYKSTSKNAEVGLYFHTKNECENHMPGLQKSMPNFWGDLNCDSVNMSILVKTVKKGDNLTGGDGSLNGTWMGDL